MPKPTTKLLLVTITVTQEVEVPDGLTHDQTQELLTWVQVDVTSGHRDLQVVNHLDESVDYIARPDHPWVPGFKPA